MHAFLHLRLEPAQVNWLKSGMQKGTSMETLSLCVCVSICECARPPLKCQKRIAEKLLTCGLTLVSLYSLCTDTSLDSAFRLCQTWSLGCEDVSPLLCCRLHFDAFANPLCTYLNPFLRLCPCSPLWTSPQKLASLRHFLKVREAKLRQMECSVPDWGSSGYLTKITRVESN